MPTGQVAVYIPVQTNIIYVVITLKEFNSKMEVQYIDMYDFRG